MSSRQSPRWTTVSFATVLLASVACAETPVQPDPGPAQGRIELTVTDVAEMPVAGATAGLSVYPADTCGQGTAITSGDATTDAAGVGSMDLEAPPEQGQRALCGVLSVEPPSGSGLQAAEVEIPRFSLQNANLVAEPPLLRVFVELSPPGA